MVPDTFIFSYNSFQLIHSLPYLNYLYFIVFKTMGNGTGLGEAIAVAGVLLAGALTSFLVIDRVGRRALLIGGGSLLFTFQLATALLMRYKFDP